MKVLIILLKIIFYPLFIAIVLVASALVGGCYGTLYLFDNDRRQKFIHG
jgi:hypothetical protein